MPGGIDHLAPVGELRVPDEWLAYFESSLRRYRRQTSCRRCRGGRPRRRPLAAGPAGKPPGDPWTGAAIARGRRLIKVENGLIKLDLGRVRHGTRSACCRPRRASRSARRTPFNGGHVFAAVRREMAGDVRTPQVPNLVDQQNESGRGDDDSCGPDERLGDADAGCHWPGDGRAERDEGDEPERRTSTRARAGRLRSAAASRRPRRRRRSRFRIQP